MHVGLEYADELIDEMVQIKVLTIATIVLQKTRMMNDQEKWLLTTFLRPDVSNRAKEVTMGGDFVPDLLEKNRKKREKELQHLYRRGLDFKKVSNLSFDIDQTSFLLHLYETTKHQ